jgi:hypothetical protein
MVFLLGVQSFLLFEENKNRTNTNGGNEGDESGNEPEEAIHDDKADDGSTYSTCCPCDVATLNAHELQRLLKSLEHGIAYVFAVIHTCCHDAFLCLFWLETEEERQSLCCCNEEDARADHHHNLLLENLLPNCKVLNINTPKKQKVPKETNWKQKFQKPQNENICLTYLNTEMNGNFHFLSFCAAFLKVQNQVL